MQIESISTAVVVVGAAFIILLIVCLRLVMSIRVLKNALCKYKRREGHYRELVAVQQDLLYDLRGQLEDKDQELEAVIFTK